MDPQDFLDELDKKFPDRHKQIHNDLCKHCPSANGFDEESVEIAKLPKELIAKEYAFVCAWRNNKLCKGNCDNMGITQEYLNELYKS